MERDLSQRSSGGSANGVQQTSDGDSNNTNVENGDQYQCTTPLCINNNNNNNNKRIITIPNNFNVGVSTRHSNNFNGNSDSAHIEPVEINTRQPTTPYGDEKDAQSHSSFSSPSAKRVQNGVVESTTSKTIENKKKQYHNQLNGSTTMITSMKSLEVPSTTSPDDAAVVIEMNKLPDSKEIDKDNNNNATSNNGNMMFDSLHKDDNNNNTTKRTKGSRIAVDEDFNLKKVSVYEHIKTLCSNVKHTLCMMRVLLKLTCVDVRERTCTYILGFCAVLVVVVVCVAMLSLLNSLPLAFLQLAEANKGQTDLQIVLGGLMSNAMSLNYTRLTEIFPHGNTNTGRHAPRIVFTANFISRAFCPSLYDQSQLWFYANGTQCSSETCMEYHCDTSNATTIDVYAYDDALERAMGLGADFTTNPPQENEIIFSHRAVSSLLNGRNDTYIGDVIMYGDMQSILPYAFRNHSSSTGTPYTMKMLQMSAAIGSNYQKFPQADRFALVNYATLVKLVASGLSPSTPSEVLQQVSSTPVEECTKVVYFNMEGNTRRKAYQSTDYNKIRQSVTRWASNIITPIGFNQISASAPITSFLWSTRMFSMFVGLIMSLILLGLAFLCIVLIYSLLTVGVETRTYDLGIQRMIGFTRENAVAMLLVNVYFFTIPAWIVGIFGGQGLYALLRKVFQKLVGVPLPVMISKSSVGWATFAAFLIPLVAAIFPMRSIIALRLSDALNSTHSRNCGVIYKIVRHGQRPLNSLMLGLGILFALFGFLLYYLFPVSLITNNLVVMFYIFFAVLAGMLAGCVLLATNFERIFETVVSYFFLFWEQRAVFRVMQKSLHAHRLRNRKTTLMYAMSVAFVIFITVAFQIQILSFRLSSIRALGGDVRATTPKLQFVNLSSVMRDLKVLIDYKYVSAITYEMDQIPLASQYALNYTLDSLGRYRTTSNSLLALPPNYFEVASSQFLEVKHYMSECDYYGLVGATYTTTEVPRVIMSTGAYNAMALNGLDSDESVAVITTTATQRTSGNSRNSRSKNDILLMEGNDNVNRINTTTRYLVQTAAVLTSAPSLTFGKYMTGGDYGNTVTSLPNAVRLTGADAFSVFEMTVKAIVFRVPNVNDYGVVVNFVDKYLNSRKVGGSVKSVTDVTETMTTAGNLLNTFFICVELIVLIICFFSLMSSMTTNVLSSSKEIAILLCMGISHFGLYRVYIWEAFVLVVAAGVLGLVVGVFVAYTMQLQNVLFTQLPLPFPFPVFQLCILIGAGFVSALASSISPVAYLLGLPSITHILRRILN